MRTAIQVSYIAALVLLTMLSTRWGRARVLAALVLLDRAVNVLVGGIWHETLSSRAHRMRAKGQPFWGWWASVIDRLFFWEHNHCAQAWASEVQAGWHQ